jgi:adenosyl cobinamide kinase/adenosyl cobinamide phosphate guanylyltransferase
MIAMTTQNEWSTKEKSIAQIIKELNTFEDQELTVMVSSDGGKTLMPVKLLGKEFDKDNKAYCTLFI